MHPYFVAPYVLCLWIIKVLRKEQVKQYLRLVLKPYKVVLPYIQANIPTKSSILRTELDFCNAPIKTGGENKKIKINAE